MEYNKNIGDSLNILLTGGHGGTVGIAVIEEIKRRYPSVIINWIGSNSAISGSKATSLEYKIYPSMGVKYFSINAGKLQTKFTRYSIPLLLLIPIGFVQAMFLLLKIKPKLILSLGGYSSFPVVFWGWLFGIPVILHEQTTVAGRSSIVSAFFAKKIALSHSESLKYFPKDKCVVTGNPVMKSILSVSPLTTHHLHPTVLVMGGSRGSEFINQEIEKIQKKLTLKYQIIHITGERDYKKYRDLTTKNYQVLSFVNPGDMASFYEKSDIVISRSGANTVSELISVKRPSILIPLPRTFMDEQYRNAEFAKEFGTSEIMPEKEVNPESLTKAIEDIFSNWDAIIRDVSEKETPDLKASEKVVDLISEYI